MSVDDLFETYFAYDVDVETGCWNARVMNRIDGYAFYRRLIYVLLVGKIPRDKMLTNTCGNGACVNPAHESLRKSRKLWLEVA